MSVESIGRGLDLEFELRTLKEQLGLVSFWLIIMVSSFVSTSVASLFFVKLIFFFVGINEDVVGIGNLIWICVSAKERLG